MNEELQTVAGRYRALVTSEDREFDGDGAITEESRVEWEAAEVVDRADQPPPQPHAIDQASLQDENYADLRFFLSRSRQASMRRWRAYQWTQKQPAQTVAAGEDPGTTAGDAR